MLITSEESERSRWLGNRAGWPQYVHLSSAIQHSKHDLLQRTW